MKKIIVLCALLLLLGANVKAEAATIVNEGFETGDFTGWTQSSAFTSAVVPVATYFISAPSYPASGNYMAAIIGTDGDGYNSISQTLSLAKGEKISGQAAFLGFNPDGQTLDAFVKIFKGNDEIAAPWLKMNSDLGIIFGASWERWEWTAQNDGDYRLVYGIVNDPSYAEFTSVALPKALFDSNAPTPAPEPSSIVLGLISLAGSAMGMKKKKVA